MDISFLKPFIVSFAGVWGLGASAQPIVIADPGFEETTLAPCAFTGGFGPQSAWISPDFQAGRWYPGVCWDLTPFEGLQVAYSNGGVIFQTLATNAVAGATYTLRIAVGRRDHGCCPFNRTTIELSAGLGDDRVILGLHEISLAQAPPPGEWLRFEFGFSAPPNLPAGLPLVIGLKATGPQVDFDAVSLSQGGGCAADFNGDGSIDFFDYDDFVACFEAPDCAAADFNHDGSADFFDYDDFVSAFEAGC
jgi:hypothetical protein